MAEAAEVARPTQGVKELLENSNGRIHDQSLPDKYIKPEIARVRCNTPLAGIPLIDFSQIHGESRSKIIQDIANAAQEWGFFQVVNHSVPLALMDAMMSAGLEFFNLPLEEKMAYFSEDYKLKLRFCTSFVPSTEAHWDWHDNLTHYFPPYGDDHPWPKKPPSYEKAAREYFDEVLALGKTISRALSQGLGLEPDFLIKAFGEGMNSIRVNYYPPCPRPDLAVGMSPHSDFGGFTILMQDQAGGLQVKRNGEWYSVKPVRGSFVVNISDQLQIFSNGKFQSAEHRAAVNSSSQRLSIVTFFEPSEDVVVAPIPELLLRNSEPPRYKESLFGTYLGKQFSKYFDSKNAIQALEINR
ncbi:2-oxoacid-dependent dioxygenase [Selaginella moellendorffii]|uniref:2-oxoacid-dependent dioxygenase n=1 Tax=Selaginella moellendorffii TaxID=88036 RepID=D8RVW1_SELML|nr:protein DMR6-LIKE OXYGENASE 2 isoform X1 [Selaginella moellendorffii]XP_024535682.1 protein DMR6-LIKE OXYGENASE 2 isoform X1 [Selaginella moellendorffii]EFJ23845.1 2-oxoacid-dependent dioxygenase [Selaginella moellendorffii]|eukprot:XP_002975060.1 protein DMR6-LIKE OXYGENASE 2 isoform X1 [Selaginella moellendorffii]